MPTLTRFRPLRPEAGTLENHVNRLLNETLGNFDWGFRDSATAAWVPPVDVLEQPDAIRINLEIEEGGGFRSDALGVAGAPKGEDNSVESLLFYRPNYYEDLARWMREQRAARQ